MSQTRMTSDAKKEGGHTPLMRAALDCQTEIAKDLLSKGTDPNALDREGHTAIMFDRPITRRGVANVPTVTRRRQDPGGDARGAGFLRRPRGEMAIRVTAPKRR
jgi:hypothetical protein